MPSSKRSPHRFTAFAGIVLARMPLSWCWKNFYGAAVCMSKGSVQLAGNCASPSLEEKVAALGSPLAYDERPRDIKVIETHFAWVFLANDYAFKLKKPVRTAYLDLSALAARRFNCVEELRLNQRLASRVYLDVVPLVVNAGGACRVGGDGLVVDWLVKMRRLPSALMLDSAIASGRIHPEPLAELGRMLAHFYAAQQCIAFDPCDYVNRIRSQMREDHFELLAPDLDLSASLVEAAAAAQASACAIVEPELRLRAEQRRIVEGHGDLRPEHICLTDPPCVIDSLEFSLDLRTLDPGEELAFLWVESARLGGASPAEQILSTYRAESGDPFTSRLLDFYRSRRAMVRAKLVAWHLLDPAFRERENWRAQAEEYLDFARRFAVHAVAGAN